MIFGTILKISKFFENVPHFIIIRTVRMDRRNIVVSLSLQMPEINSLYTRYLSRLLISHRDFAQFFLSLFLPRQPRDQIICFHLKMPR